MITGAIISYLHFIAAIGVVCSVLFEWVIYSKNPSLIDARRLQMADMVYGVSAGLVLVFGFLRLFYFEKGVDFYFENQFYYVKLYVFAAVGIISVYPTIRFFKWRGATKAGDSPVVGHAEYTMVRWILRAEVVGLFVMILAASMMAKGVGVDGG